MTTKQKRLTIKLSRNEHIIACVPEYHAGPGWSNHTVTVWIQDSATGKVREERIQPSEMTVKIDTLFALAAQAHSQLLSEIRTFVKVKK